MPDISERQLTISDVNNLIELLIGDDVSIHAVQRTNGIYLAGHGEKDIKLSPEDLTREKMLKILYDYAVYAGYTNEDFSDFVGG